MKKLITILSLSSLLLTGYSTCKQERKIIFEEYNKDVLNQAINVPTKQIKKVNSNDDGQIVDHSKIFYQTGADANAKYLRFATAIDGSKELNSITYTRTLSTFDEDSVPATKIVDVDTIYKGIQSGNEINYYNPTTKQLTTDVNESGDYYFACYTIKFSKDTYKDSDITISLTINGIEDSTTITTKLWDNIEEYKLVFDTFTNSEYFVGDTLDLNAYGVKNGKKNDDVINYEISNATLENNKAVLNKSGNVSIKATYQGQSITQNIKVFNKVSTTSDFLAIGNDINSMKEYYKLVNDIDFKGQTIKAFSSYHSNLNTKLAFYGIFDGQGYTVANFTPMYNATFHKDGKSDRDISIFGLLNGAAIVKNTNFIGVKMFDRSSVISSLNYGTIENCYVEATYIYNAGINRNATNPAGVIVSKMANGSISNCITKFTVAENASIYATDNKTICVGSFIGAANGGKITNCYAICEDERLGFYSIKGSSSTLTNTQKVANVSEFYETIDTTTFAKIWSFNQENKTLPHLGNIKMEVVENATAYNNNSFDLSTLITSNIANITFTLKDEIENVSIVGNELKIGAVEAGRQIKVLASDGYNEKEITIVIKNLGLTCTSEDKIEFDLIKEVNEEKDFSKPHNVKVLLEDGTEYEGNVTIKSSNESVATVVGNNIVATGSGTAIISVEALGISLKEIVVNSTIYTPIRNVDEYIKIRTNATTLSDNYKLMNDIDFENQRINTNAHYSEGYTSASKGFSGIFDGQGYSLKNMSFGYQDKTSANCGAFGTVATKGVIKNVNFINALIDNRISGVIAVMNYGTISNCFVDCTNSYNTKTDANNPMGAIVSKNYGTIECCVANLVISAENNINIGAIVGRNYDAGIINNCLAIANVGVTESAKPTNTPTSSSAGKISNAMAFETLDLLLEDTTINKDLLETFAFTSTSITHNGKVVYTLETN